MPITHEDMTRFNITLGKAVDMIFYALENAWGGEIFVPKIPSFKITDLADAIAPNTDRKIVGIRNGEKIHEEMITSSDSFNTYDIGKYFTILPTLQEWSLEEYITRFNAKKVAEGFSYSSGNNSEWLTIDDLRNLIKENIDSEFS